MQTLELENGGRRLLRSKAGRSLKELGSVDMFSDAMSFRLSLRTSPEQGRSSTMNQHIAVRQEVRSKHSGKGPNILMFFLD